MADLYAKISEIPRETQEMLGDALTTRANEAQMIEMRRQKDAASTVKRR